MKKITSLVDISSEHGFGAVHNKGFVVLRTEDEDGHHTHTQFEPEQAREIATFLMAAAARAEYEQDLHSGLSSVDFEPEMIATILHLVRTGEMTRMMRIDLGETDD